jgi:hypothetical protein
MSRIRKLGDNLLTSGKEAGESRDICFRGGDRICTIIASSSTTSKTMTGELVKEFICWRVNVNELSNTYIYTA